MLRMCMLTAALLAACPAAAQTSSSTKMWAKLCGPASFHRPECKPAKPAYRHHHSHCYYAAGVRHCT